MLQLRASTAGAQSPATGSLEVFVTDSAGVTLNGAMVTLSGAAGGGLRSRTTGRVGPVVFRLLPPGEYMVLVERIGYRPTRVEAVQLRPGGRLTVPVALRAAAPPLDEEDVVRGANPAAGLARPGVASWYSARDLSALPADRRELSELAGRSTTSSAELEMEGLPASMGGITIDGVPFEAARHPHRPAGGLAAAAFPLSAFETVDLVHGGTDVEWTGAGGGHLAGYTRSGMRELGVQAFGRWSADPLTSSEFFDPGASPTTSLWGGLLVGGPVLRDTASFIVGIEARSLETAFPQAWAADTLADRVLAVARDSFGIGLDRYARPRIARVEALNAFGRLDWQLAAGHHLSVRANLASLPEVDRAPDTPGSLAFDGRFEGRDASAALVLASDLDETLAQELRVGFESSLRDFTAGTADDAAPAALPATRIIAGGIGFGTDAGGPGRFERSAARLSYGISARREAHTLKLGASGVWNSLDQTYAAGRGGEVFFAGPDELARREGVLAQTLAPAPVARFSVLRYGLFVQDDWRPAPGLEITAGARIDLESIPRDEVQPNAAWFEASGLANVEIDDRVLGLAPRLGFTWNVGARNLWFLRGAAGIEFDEVDPGVLGEIITHAAGVETRRIAGTLADWPALPAAPDDGTVTPRLALLGPEFSAPRTGRASFGLSRLLGEATALHLSGTYRRTDFLVRRADLNLLPGPTAHDQYGRPIYGQLVQQGGLLAAEPGSNRRFPEFDRVWALNADGWSTYASATVGFDHQPAGGLALFGRYTFSSTRDNVLATRGGDPEAQLAPDAGTGNDWAEGRSDLDVPHRLVLGGELRFGGRLQPALALIYRFRSGYPFTPGFRDGVDANADGSARNDPAHVDPGIDGVASLIGEWDCLREQAGALAERNACREPGVHSLDLRLGADLIGFGRYRARLTVDGLNLIESDVAELDRALYLVDAALPIETDATAGTATLPLVANPNFGKPLVRWSSGRTLRLGLQVSY